MDEPIRILIVDDHAIVRKGLAMVLRLEPGFDVIGEAGDGQAGLEAARSLHPDLVLLDVVMPRLDGRAAAQAIKAEMPEMRVLMLTGAELDNRLLDTLATSADGYVIKDIEPDELKLAIRAVAKGESYIHPTVAKLVLEYMSSSRAQSPETPLTRREHEILQHMATPATYQEIAVQLSLSEETVRSHAKHVLHKLGQPNRIQAVLAAVRAGLIPLPEE